MHIEPIQTQRELTIIVAKIRRDAAAEPSNMFDNAAIGALGTSQDTAYANSHRPIARLTTATMEQ
jgi:hypothetical protein